MLVADQSTNSTVDEVILLTDADLNEGVNTVLVHMPSQRRHGGAQWLLNLEDEERYWVGGIVKNSTETFFIYVVVFDAALHLHAGSIIAHTRSLASIVNSIEFPTLLLTTPCDDTDLTIRRMRQQADEIALPYALSDDDPDYKPDYSDYSAPTTEKLDQQLECFNDKNLTINDERCDRLY